MSLKGRGAASLYSALLVDAVGSGLFLPVSLLYFTRVSGIGLATVGLLISVATALTLPLPLVAGHLVDRFGSRNVVLGAQLVQAAGFFLYLAVSGPAMLMIAALIVASGQRMFWSSVFTLVADLADRNADGDAGRGHDRWFAVVGMVQAAGYGVGGLLTGLLLTVGTVHVYRTLAVANAISFLCSALLLVLFARGIAPPHRAASDAAPGAKGGYRALLADKPYLGLILTNTVFALCSVFFGTALPVYLVDGLPAPKWMVGVLLAVNTGLLAIGQAFVARLVRPLTRVRALVIAGGLWTVWCVASALAIRLPAGVLVPYLVAVTLCYTLAELIHAPISNALAAAAAPPESRGRYLAAFQYCFTVATIVAPGLFGVLFTHGRALPWLAVGVLILVGTIAMATLERRLPDTAVRGEPQPAEAAA